MNTKDIILDPKYEKWRDQAWVDVAGHNKVWRAYIRNPFRDRQISTLGRFVLEEEGVLIPDGHMVVHINKNPLDCRVANLRIQTQSANSINRPAASKYLHVSRFGARGAQTPANGKIWGAMYDGRSLGRFFTEEAAAAAVAEAAGWTELRLREWAR